ncbi:hypothetical protein SAMN05216474_1989 [Lishizhenia tianjinensis]|uniref:Fimbrillin-like n=1 Tax=Lishizhenia tianjinensis TaxID=477690 RepID=A0A1I7AE64_9FLAO|nr:hypothetical protein [Lishizhenia tianjinensis]SFT73130.1 hypothetical protein SAMN05216474_1989 [Lishizhenia tianjinensis]
MKKNIIKGITLLAIPALILGACKKIDVTDGVVEIFNITDSRTNVTFQFVDAVTGEKLDMNGNEDIQIRLGGQNAEDVTDNFGNKNFGSEYGLLSLAIPGYLTPSESNIVEFTLHATANGYLPSSTDIVLFDEGLKSITIPMISTSNAPQDVRLTTDVLSGVSSAGELNANYTLSPGLSNSGTTAEVNILAGTKLMDKNGIGVTGNVDVELAYFDPNGKSTFTSLPGDLTRAPISSGGYVRFNTIGAISLDMFAGTKEVKNFDTPIQMTMSIPSGSQKMDGTDIVAGDNLGIYSYDEENSEWTLESTETVSYNTSTGLLEVTFPMSHLSTWQVAEGEKEPGNLSFNNVTFTANCQDYFLNTTNIEISFWYGMSGHYFPWGYKEVARFSFDSPMKIKTGKTSGPWHWNLFYKWNRKSDTTDVIWGEADYGKNITVDLPESWCVYDIEKFKIKLSTYCPDTPNRLSRPSIPVYAVEEGKFFVPGSEKLLGYMKQGELETSTAVLEKGKKYTLYTIYQFKLVFLTGSLDNFDFGSRLVDGKDIDLSRPLTQKECAYLKG